MSTMPPPNPDAATAAAPIVAVEREDARQVFIGIVLMTVGVMLLPIMDSSAKILGGQLSMNPVAVACYRFVMQIVLMAPIVLYISGLRGFIPRPLHIQFLRGAFLGGATIIYFLSIRQMPLATTLAIYFLFPLIVTVLSGLFMGEAVGPRRYAAVLVGFVGVVIIIQPGTDAMQPIALLTVSGAFCFSMYFVLSKYLSGRESPWVLHFHTGVFGMLVTGAAVLVFDLTGIETGGFAIPGWQAFGLIGLMGLVSTVAHLMLIQAMARAPASTLAPFGYAEMISAVAIGYVLFGDFPDALAWLGIVIIIGSGLFVAWRERVRAREGRQAE